MAIGRRKSFTTIRTSTRSVFESSMRLNRPVIIKGWICWRSYPFGLSTTLTVNYAPCYTEQKKNRHTVDGFFTLLVVSLSQNTRSHSCRHRLTSTSTGLMLSLPSTARVPPRSVMVVLGVSSIPFATHKQSTTCRERSLCVFQLLGVAASIAKLPSIVTRHALSLSGTRS